MKNLIFVLLALTGCGLHDYETDPAHDSKVEIAEVEDECRYDKQAVTLEFKEKTIDGDNAVVTFLVKESDGKQFISSAKLGRVCSDDFEKRKEIPGTLSRIKFGACAPEVVLPKEYDHICWRLM